MNLANKTKSELLEIIKQKEDEIKTLNEDIASLNMYKKYEDLTDEIKDVYDKLISKGFKSDEALEITETMISSGHIENIRMRVPYRSYK